jgi:hypothetical protein
MTLTDALRNSRDLVASIDRDINGTDLPATDRDRLSAALLDQAHEHHKAILILIEQGMIGSAFSLVRAMFETAVRGIWLYYCATDADLSKFQTDKLEKSFGAIVSEVEGVLGADGGALSTVKSKYWSGMCSYTHGGYLQAVRRITSEHITPAYGDDEKVEAIRFADFCQVLVAVVIFSMVHRPDLADKWAKHVSGANGDVA